MSTVPFTDIKLQAPRLAHCSFCHKKRKCLQKEHIGAQVMVCKDCELLCISSFQLFLTAKIRFIGI